VAVPAAALGGPVRIGVVTEVKEDERRVAMGPEGVAEAVRLGHDVLVQAGAGRGAGFADDVYAAAGATIVDGPDAVFEQARLLVHVKEPQPEELARLRPDHVLFTYLHLAAYPAVADGLRAAGCTAIGYETVELDGRLPLLAPMSHIAGRLSVQMGAHFLTAPAGGKGKLLGGHTGVPPAQVVVIGAGASGLEAADVALGLGAEVTVIDIDLAALERARARFGTRIVTDYSTRAAVAGWTRRADLVIGAVLVAGDRAPVVVDRDMLADIEDGSVVVDIAIDQGGCIATSEETSHADPVRVVDGIVHYAVGNIPGAVPQTATRALVNATLRYVLALADGVEPALARFPELVPGVNVVGGHITNASVAHALDAEHVPLTDALHRG
jgi:alanine dehydrogenase